MTEGPVILKRSKTLEADQPIQNSNQDRFGRKQFAHRVAEVVATRDSKSGIVVGIHAPWGEGKTSVLNMILEELAKHEHVVVIKFNPWRFPEESLLLRAFFVDIARQIDASLETQTEKLSSIAEDYAELLSVVPYAGKLGEVVKIFVRKRSRVDLDDVRGRFERALKNSSKRVIIVMDDIDRLDKEEVHVVFRLVKLLADFPNTTYILSFDDKRVAQVLGEKYGANFLEKIIQVPLYLPPASRHARKAVAVEGLEAALRLAKISLSNDDGRRLGEIFDKAFINRITTPRLAKRLGNALTFALPILVGEVDTVDLILIEAIRILYPELYAVIRNNEDAFLGTVFDPLSPMDESDAKAYVERTLNSALETYSAEDRKSAGAVIQALFPRTGVSDLFRAGGYSSDFNDRWANEKRIGTKEYYPRYFNYGVPSDDISDREVEAFLERVPRTSVGELVGQFKNLSSNHRANVLIDKLRAREDKLPAETAAILTLVVAESGNQLPYSHPTDRFFGLSTYSQASAHIRHLLHRITDQSARESLALDIAKRIVPLPLAFDYLVWMRKLKQSRYSDEMVSVISEEREKEIEKIIVRRLIGFAESTPIERAYPMDAQQLYRLWAHVDKDSLRECLRRRSEIYHEDVAEFVSAVNGIDPNSETSRDWKEDFGWFDFMCDLIPPDQILSSLRRTYSQLSSAEYNFVDARPMNNKERAARWFQRLYREKYENVKTAGGQPKIDVSEGQPATSDISLEPILEHAVKFESDERSEHQLTFSIKNTSSDPINDYRLEIEFPAAFLNKEWHPSWEEPERRTETHRFFRMTQQLFSGDPSKWKLFGGDTRLLLTIDYHVDEKNDDAEALAQSIWVTAYAGDTPVRRIHKPMSDFIN